MGAFLVQETSAIARTALPAARNLLDSACEVSQRQTGRPEIGNDTIRGAMAGQAASPRRVSAREAVTHMCACLHEAGVPSVSPEVLRRAKRREAAEAGMVRGHGSPLRLAAWLSLHKWDVQHESLWSALVELSVAMRRGLDWLLDGGSAPTAASRLDGPCRRPSGQSYLFFPLRRMPALTRAHSQRTSSARSWRGSCGPSARHRGRGLRYGPNPPCTRNFQRCAGCWRGTTSCRRRSWRGGATLSVVGRRTATTRQPRSARRLWQPSMKEPPICQSETGTGRAVPSPTPHATLARSRACSGYSGYVGPSALRN